MAAIRQLTALDMPQLDGQVPRSCVLGSTVDASACAQFDWHKRVWSLEPQASFLNENRKCSGRWLGVAEVSTDVMASCILTENGAAVARKSTWALLAGKAQTDETKQATKELSDQITLKLSNSLPLERDSKGEPADPLAPPPPADLWNNLNDAEEVVDPFDPDATALDTDEQTPKVCDECLMTEALLPQGGEFLKSMVMSRKADSNGNPIELRSVNPLLGSCQREVEFSDGSTEAFTANLIAGNLLSPVCAKGRSHSILSEIVDHCKNGKALPEDDALKF